MPNRRTAALVLAAFAAADARGASPAVTFAVTVADGGKNVAPNSFYLRSKTFGDGSIGVALERLLFANGTLTAAARLRNASDRPLLGLRLEVVPSDAVKVLPAPLLLGDAGSKKDVEPGSVGVSGLEARPSNLTVTFALSGYALAATIAEKARQIDVDAKGRLVTCGGDSVVKRYETDGKEAGIAAKLPGACESIAVDRASGTLFALAKGAAGVLRFDAEGQAKGPAPGSVDLAERPTQLRLDAKGGVLAAIGGGFVRFTSGKAEPASTPPPKSDAQGNVWSLDAGERLTVKDRAGHVVRVLGKKPASGVSLLAGAHDLALAPDGRVFVAASSILVLERF